MKLIPLLLMSIITGLVALVLFLPERPRILVASDNKAREDAFAKRLKIAAADEESIVRSLKESFPSILGMSPHKLDSAHKDLLVSLVRKQGEIREEAGRFQVDLREHLSKNKNDLNEKVLLEIQWSEVDSELALIQERLTNNQSYPAAESAMAWATRLRHWAKQMREVNPNNQNQP